MPGDDRHYCYKDKNYCKIDLKQAPNGFKFIYGTY